MGRTCLYLLTILMVVFPGISAVGAAESTSAGLVRNITGNLTAKTPANSLRKLNEGDSVTVGDTLYTDRDSYARVRFNDGGEVMLRPSTHFLIADYKFIEREPAEDKAGFSLLKGGLRAISGMLGKRSKADDYAMKTPNATIGIRGTDYAIQLCRKDCEEMRTMDGKLPRDGLHAQVNDGAIVMTNKTGSLELAAGEFAYVAAEDAMPEKVSSEEALHISIPEHILWEWNKKDQERDQKECPAE